MGAQLQTSFPPRHKPYMNLHPADLELSGTHRQLIQGLGGTALAWDRSHMTPPTWNGLVAKECLQKALSHGRPQSSLGGREAQAVLGRAERIIVFLLSL